MSGKNSKKIRQQYRKEFGREARKMGRMIGNRIKPRPRFIPETVWMAMMRIFIDI